MTTELSTSTKPVPLTWVESLFARMQGIYGNKFLDMWRDTDADLVKSMWAEEMGKMTPEELKRGYNALMTRDWPPSLPEYVKLCRPPVEDMRAYYEAVAGISARERGEMGQWSHPAIYWAAVKIGNHDLKNVSFSLIKVRWESALASEMAKGSWAPVPEPLQALPAPGQASLSREEADKRVKELKLEAGKPEKTDHLLWMKRILAREKKGDKTLTALQKREAKEAARNVGYRP